MANAIFPKGKQGFINGDIDWSTATIKAALVRGYTFDEDHEFVSDVTAADGTLVVTSAGLANKGSEDGVADADDVVNEDVAAGDPITSIIVFQSSAVTGGADVAATAQRLIAYVDTGTNLPITPNSGDLTIQWSALASRIFAL